jgi:hypothetical protein
MTQHRYHIRCDAAGQDILAGTSHALTELINTVAPPISEHEVVQVWMTHRMKGYDGVESVVYQGIMKVSLTPRINARSAFLQQMCFETDRVGSDR